MPIESTKFEATAYVLRIRHAERAEQLLSRGWRTATGELFLLDDYELRRTYGSVIGKIAHSHWWDLPRLAADLSITLGAAVGLPQEWTVNVLKIACLLRAADVSNIDARRAPAPLLAIRTPSGISRDHWTFQSRVHQPRLTGDRLEYTAGEAFPIEDAAAWWLCFDTLRQINIELQQMDALLADRQEQRFAARGVLGVDEPGRLKTYIRTSGWEPVDTSIRIGDVASLVRKLGGEHLYGTRSKAPLRELIQNASDAVRARRVIESLSPDWGKITVSLYRTGDEDWLDVSDNGVGMSTAALTKSLLDFGFSYWDSQLVREEMPGVLSSGFQPTGKFGIGFFSAFMWSNRIQVITRRYDEAHRKTQVLEFRNGVNERPVLREASSAEYVRDGGTVVRLLLNRRPEEDDGLLSTYGGDELWTLKDLVVWLCPATDVTLEVKHKGKGEIAVRAGDWLTIPGNQLLKRLMEPDSRLPPVRMLKQAGRQLRIIKDKHGTPVGRAAILKDPHYYYDGIVTVDGFRHCDLSGIDGILAGTPTLAARTLAIPTVDGDRLASWASEQATLVTRGGAKDEHAAIAAVVLSCRGNAQRLPIVRTRKGWLTESEWERYARGLNDVLLGDFSDYEWFQVLPHLKLHRSVALASEEASLVGGVEGTQAWLPPPPHTWRWWSRIFWSPQGRLIQALSRSWNITLDDLLLVIDFYTPRGDPIQREIGTLNGKPFKTRVAVIQRPSATALGV